VMIIMTVMPKCAPTCTAKASVFSVSGPCSIPTSSLSGLLGFTLNLARMVSRINFGSRVSGGS
jgi:hypothetical protein